MSNSPKWGGEICPRWHAVGISQLMPFSRLVYGNQLVGLVRAGRINKSGPQTSSRSVHHRDWTILSAFFSSKIRQSSARLWLCSRPGTGRHSCGDGRNDRRGSCLLARTSADVAVTELDLPDGQGIDLIETSAAPASRSGLILTATAERTISHGP
jgi:hypothetical protein